MIEPKEEFKKRIDETTDFLDLTTEKAILNRMFEELDDPRLQMEIISQISYIEERIKALRKEAGLPEEPPEI